MQKSNFYSINQFEYEKSGKVERYYYTKLESGYRYHIFNKNNMHDHCIVAYIDRCPYSKSQWRITSETGFGYGKKFRSIKEALHFLETFDFGKIVRAEESARSFLKRNSDKIRTEAEIEDMRKEMEEN